MKMPKTTITELRRQRARRLSAAVLQWRRLADRYEYPRALEDIAAEALAREYALGRRAGIAAAVKTQKTRGGFTRMGQ